MKYSKCASLHNVRIKSLAPSMQTCCELSVYANSFQYSEKLLQIYQASKILRLRDIGFVTQIAFMAHCAPSTINQWVWSFTKTRPKVSHGKNHYQSCCGKHLQLWPFQPLELTVHCSNGYASEYRMLLSTDICHPSSGLCIWIKHGTKRETHQTNRSDWNCAENRTLEIHRMMDEAYE